MPADIADDLPHAGEQAGVLQQRLADGDPVLTELASVSHQTGRVRQGPHRNRSVVGRHAAKIAAGNERCPRAQVRGTERCDHTGRPSPNHHDVQHHRRSIYT
jgi:hypothetical protein